MALSKVAPEVAGAITEHARIIRFRHILVHGYDKVDYDVLWSVLESKLLPLEKDIERLLTRLNEAK